MREYLNEGYSAKIPFGNLSKEKHEVQFQFSFFFLFCLKLKLNIINHVISTIEESFSNPTFQNLILLVM